MVPHGGVHGGHMVVERCTLVMVDVELVRGRSMSGMNQLIKSTILDGRIYVTYCYMIFDIIHGACYWIYHDLDSGRVVPGLVG